MSNICSFRLQEYDELYSMVCQFQKHTLLHEFSRKIIDELVRSPINSQSGIKLSLNKPLNNDIDLNILRPAVLRQYYGMNITEGVEQVKRYTYGSGSGTSSVGMDPLNFVTRPWNAWMIAMSHDIQCILNDNKKLFKLNNCNLEKKFNHCTILIYYAGSGLKKISSLGYHTDCVYSPSSGEYISKLNSQVENTPAVIYSVGDTRYLHWKVRKMGFSASGRNIWENATSSKMSFKLGSDTLTIINPDDENPRSSKNKHDMRQYMHGGVNVSGNKFSVGFVFRVVNNSDTYHTIDDTMVVPNQPNDIVNGIIGFDIGAFHARLINLYYNTLY